VRTVVSAVDGSADLLELLHALSIADGLATGPAAWSDWKAGLVARLVERAASVLAGAPLPVPPPLAPELRDLATPGRLAVRIDGDAVTVAAPDERGLLSRTAGVLALHQLDVRSADIRTVATRAGPAMAVNVFTVSPRYGRGPDPALLRDDMAGALGGTLRLAERLAVKERAYERRRPDGEPAAALGFPPPPRVLWFDDAASDATVVELRAADAVGLLHRVTGALEECGLDVRTARVSTLGGAVVDAFYVLGPDGAPVLDAGLRASVERALLAAAVSDRRPA
jgi:[protein-PII] uridylyltransferase